MEVRSFDGKAKLTKVVNLELCTFRSETSNRRSKEVSKPDVVISLDPRPIPKLDLTPYIIQDEAIVKS